MSLTQGEWSVNTVNDHLVLICDVVQTVAEEYSATLKTPKELDTTKSFVLIVNSEAVTLDGDTCPVDLYGGYADTFDLSVTTSTLTVTDGFLLNPDIMAAVESSVGVVIVDPNLNIADDADDIVRGASIPYYGIVLDGGDTLLAVTVRFIIVQ